MPCIYTFFGDKYIAEKAMNRLKEGAHFIGAFEQCHDEISNFTTSVTVLTKIPISQAPPTVPANQVSTTVKFLLQSPVKFLL